MNTYRTPLSVHFRDEDHTGIRPRRAETASKTISYRPLFVGLAVVASLMVAGTAGYSIYTHAKQGSTNFDSITTETEAIGQLGSEITGTIVEEDSAAPAKGPLISCGGLMYLVVNAKKRLIPNTQTFNSLFGAAGSKNIQALSNQECALIPTGKGITPGARLIQCQGFSQVFLESNGMKRWLCNPSTINMYHFTWANMTTLPLAKCNAICNGPTICDNSQYTQTAAFGQVNTQMGIGCPAAKIKLYACPPGSHETGVDNVGNCICKLCPPGYKCPGGYRAKAKCSAGTYQPHQGQANCILASPGYYVSISGSIKQYLCPQGQFQYAQGGTACRRSNPGMYIVMINGIAHQKQCPRGTYQPQAGMHKCVPASPGYYVAFAGWSNQVPCAPGTYQPAAGSWACLNATAGYYVAVPASKIQYACHFGTYQPLTGQRGCRMASAGYHVPVMGSMAEVICPANTYQHCLGQRHCIQCPAAGGQYLPLSVQKKCGLIGAPHASTSTTSSTTTSTTTTTSRQPQTTATKKQSTPVLVRPHLAINQVQFHPPQVDADDDDVDEIVAGDDSAATVDDVEGNDADDLLAEYEAKLFGQED